MITIEQARELEVWQETALVGKARPLPKTSALKALEEMVEFAYACGADQDEIHNIVKLEEVKAGERGYAYPDGPNYEEMETEFGDVVACIYMVAYFNQIPMTAAVDNTLMRISSRDWTPGEDGILRRPKS